MHQSPLAEYAPQRVMLELHVSKVTKAAVRPGVSEIGEESGIGPITTDVDDRKYVSFQGCTGCTL